MFYFFFCFFFSSRRRHTRLQGDWSSDVCSSDLERGHEHPPCLTGTAWLTPLVHHLDEHRFGLNVIALVGRTLERDDPDFLRAVDVDDGQIPGASALLARLRGEHLA